MEAYWTDFLRAANQPEATDDVHGFCDVVRGSSKVYVLLSETKGFSNSLSMLGKRLWCLPECLLAPGHVIHVQGTGKSETISIMQLPARAWTSPYFDEAGNGIQGRGRREEFRLLAEHFSGLLTLSVTNRRLTASDCPEGNRRDCNMSGNQTSGKKGGV